jgi:hypothetical protein
MQRLVKYCSPRMLSRGKLQYTLLEATLNLKKSGSGQIRLIEAVPSGSATGRIVYLKQLRRETKFKYFEKMNNSRSK